VIVPPRSTAVLSEDVETTPTQRDRHLQSIAEHGRIGWQTRSGYTRRALIEAIIGRFNESSTMRRARGRTSRATEIAIAVHVLNCMLELVRRRSVRVACMRAYRPPMRPQPGPQQCRCVRSVSSS
jgi:hypothetical protein